MEGGGMDYGTFTDLKTGILVKLLQLDVLLWFFVGFFAI